MALLQTKNVPIKKEVCQQTLWALNGLANRWTELRLTMRRPFLLAALLPQRCKQWQECSWGFNSWQTPSCLQKNCNISNSCLCLPAKSHLKALYPDVPISVFNLLLFINQTCLGDDSYIPYILLHMTYSTQISIAWGMLCQEGYSEHQKLKNSIPSQFWTTFTIKTPFPNYFFIHRVLRKPQKQVSQDSMLIIGCIFVLASHHLFFSSKTLG